MYCPFCGSKWRIWSIWWVLRWLLPYVMRRQACVLLITYGNSTVQYWVKLNVTEFSIVFFCTNRTAHFYTKETKQIEPYHLIGSFGCQGGEVWVHINKKHGGWTSCRASRSIERLGKLFFLQKNTTIHLFGCYSMHISSVKPAISIHSVFPRCSSEARWRSESLRKTQIPTTKLFFFSSKVAVVFYNVRQHYKWETTHIPSLNVLEICRYLSRPRLFNGWITLSSG